jgi:hypothetical protein
MDSENNYKKNKSKTKVVSIKIRLLIHYFKKIEENFVEKKKK